jgi:hypothetical protein
MKLHWTDVAIATALMAAGCVAIYAGLARVLRFAVAERQRTMDRQLAALTMTVKALQMRVAEMGEAEPARIPPDAVNSAAGASENMAGEEGEQVRPETLAAITAAATAFLGKKARVRAVQALPVQNAAGAWAQQGRVIVQTSHNLRPGA